MKLESSPRPHLPPIAEEISSRAHGSYQLWSLLVMTNFLGGKWGETDWATCVVGVKGGELARIETPMNTREDYQMNLLKYDMGLSRTVLLSELTAAYENGMYGHVHSLATEARDLNASGDFMQDIDNYFEWFVRAASTKDLSPTGPSKTQSLKRAIGQVKGRLYSERNFELVHRIYVSATRLTLTE